MSVTASGLARAAGVAAAGAGALYILIQFVHPIETVDAVLTDAWAIVHYLSVAMAVLGLAGVAGLYLIQVRKTGLLGLLGFLLLSGFFLVQAAYNFVEALLLPPLAKEAPGVVEDILRIFSGVPADGSLGAIEQISTVAFALYLLGGVTFGIALFRARVVQRWAGLLLAVGAAASLLVPMLPHSLARSAAIPVGLALVWLGYSLWSAARGRRSAPQAAVPAPVASTVG